MRTRVAKITSFTNLRPSPDIPGYDHSFCGFRLSKGVEFEQAGGHVPILNHRRQSKLTGAMRISIVQKSDQFYHCLFAQVTVSFCGGRSSIAKKNEGLRGRCPGDLLAWWSIPMRPRFALGQSLPVTYCAMINLILENVADCCAVFTSKSSWRRWIGPRLFVVQSVCSTPAIFARTSWNPQTKVTAGNSAN